MVVVHIIQSIMNGGVGAVARNLILEQEKQGIKTAVVTNINENKFACDWISQNNLKTSIYFIEEWRTRRMTVWGGYSKSQHKKILNDYADEDIILHYHNPISVGFFSYLKCPTVCTMHGCIISDRFLTKLIFKYTMKRFLLNKGMMVGCSNYTTDYYRNIFKNARIHSVRNGISRQKIGENKYVSNNGNLHIGFASYIDDLKGWYIVRDAYEALQDDEKTKVEIYFAGELDDSCKADFYAFVNKYNNVKYIGYISDAPSNFFPYLDIFVLPSRTEGMPMAILEAMQAETAIIATSVGGIPEVVIDRQSGFIIERNGNDLCDKFRILLSHPRVLESLKKGAFRIYQERATAEIMANGYNSLYKKLLKRKIV